MDKSEPLGTFFCKSKVFWGGTETWIQQQCTSFSCYFALQGNIAPDRLRHKTHTYTQNRHEHTVLQWGWHRQQPKRTALQEPICVSLVDCRPRGKQQFYAWTPTAASSVGELENHDAHNRRCHATPWFPARQSPSWPQIEQQEKAQHGQRHGSHDELLNKT